MKARVKKLRKINGVSLLRSALLLVILTSYVALAFLLSRHTAYYNPYHLAGGDTIAFEKAKIVSVAAESFNKDQKHPDLLVGSQNVTALVLTGKYGGRRFDLVNNLNYDTNYLLHAGQTVVVSISASGDGKTVSVNFNSPDRTGFLYLMAGLFALLLCAVGGRRGFRSVVAIVFTLTSVFFIFVPLLYRGVAPAAAAVLLAAVVSCVTLPLTGGLEWKSLVAILGTAAGVAIAALTELVFSALTHASGYTLGDTDAILAVSSHSGLQVGSLLFAAVLISSLGAVLDVAISVASSVNELYQSSPGAGGRALFRSGMNVGRDMMGTMANTLILAFTGSSLLVLIQIYTYNMPYEQVMNSNNVTVEILSALTGSMAVILTVPAVSLPASLLLPRLIKRKPGAD